jgi:hypothetical protein
MNNSADCVSTHTNTPRARERRSYQQIFLLEIFIKASRFPLVGSVLGTLLFSACSDVQNPAAPTQGSFTSSSSQNTSYSGRATVVQATVLGGALIAPITLVDAGPLTSSGGADEKSLLEANVPGVLTAEVLHAATSGQGSRSSSEASVAELSVTAGGNSVSAGFLMSKAEAKCTDGTASASGSSEIARLGINGQTIAVSGAPNQTIALPNGRLIINEQQGAPGDITVNALHIIVDGIADIVVASAHADIGCPTVPPPPPPTCPDFVTGGGWIVGTPSGARANFAVAGGVKDGGFWGHLNYIDHGLNGPKVKGTGVTGYGVIDATTRWIAGTAEVDGQPGTYRVEVLDAGEPGRADRFALKLSNGYTATGELSGGNLQLHNSCS